jgi:SpoVK/Ycf46/Vps4 family AAA+-type ATPase
MPSSILPPSFITTTSNPAEPGDAGADGHPQGEPAAATPAAATDVDAEVDALLSAAAAAAPFESDLEHLEAELKWLGYRAARIARKRHGRRDVDVFAADPDPDSLDDLYEPGEPYSLVDDIRRFQRKEDRERALIDARRAASRATGRPTSFDRLCDDYNLGPVERMALLASAAVCVGREFQRALAQVEGSGRGHVTSPNVEHIFDLCELPLAERLAARWVFTDVSPLVAHRLVRVESMWSMQGLQDLLGAGIALELATFDVLVGDPSLSASVSQFAALELPRARMEDVVLPQDVRKLLLRVVSSHERTQEVWREWGMHKTVSYGTGTLLLLHGDPGTGKTMSGHAIAAHLGLKVLNVNARALLAADGSGEALSALFRAARYHGALLLFDECEELLQSRSLGSGELVRHLLKEFERFDGIAVMATNRPNDIDEAMLRRFRLRVHFPRPDRTARAEILRRLLPPAGAVDPDLDVERLASRYETTGGLLKNAVLNAVASAVVDQPDQPVVRESHLDEALAQQVVQLSTSEQSAEFSARRRADLALAPELGEQVDELIDAARNRSLIFERWGVAPRSTRGQGVSALFFGPPGTGKTMCAEVVAGELHRPLMRCDLAQVQSMYVGQTERQLSGLFAAAHAQNAVLLIDEADALLSQRGGAPNERYADRWVSLLLGLVENYTGVVLLTSNAAERLDPALERRLQFRLYFGPPGIKERAAIWRGLLPSSVPTDGSIDTDRLAAAYELTGGQIAGAVVRGARKAAAGPGVLTHAHLMEAAAAESVSLRPTRCAGFGTR